MNSCTKREEMFLLKGCHAHGICSAPSTGLSPDLAGYGSTPTVVVSVAVGVKVGGAIVSVGGTMVGDSVAVGSSVGTGVSVGPGVSVGNGVSVAAGASVGRDVRVGVSVGVTVRVGVQVGVGSSVGIEFCTQTQVRASDAFPTWS